MASGASHFVVSNYNYDPSVVLSYASKYTLYDQSDLPEFTQLVASKFPDRIASTHTGHNLSDYFQFFLNDWDDLDPEDSTVLIKGNAIGRHMTQEYFERVFRNDTYTFLYADPCVELIPGVSSLVCESQFLERNNSWFADSKQHRYFSQTNQLLSFLYQDPVLPSSLLFAPGGCYIVPNKMILRLPRSLFAVLHQIVSYTLFPSEAYMVERVMHTIFTSPTPLRRYLWGIDSGLTELELLPDRTNERLPKEKLLTRALNRLHLRRMT